VKITSVKGFRDVLPDEAERRRAVVEAAVGVLRSYGFREIELPLLERGELFSKSVGATSDIVEKEMYAFTDRDGTLVALRPEGTASVARAYIEGGLARSMPVARLYYVGPMFRRERPQKGRFRQFSQIGAELIGRDDPAADAETICMVSDLCAAAGVRGARIDINSLGDAECRPRYREALVAFGRAHFDELCQDCRSRMERNPLRLLDCKNEACRAVSGSAPMMLDYLCEGCRSHHDRVLELLAAMEVPVTPNPRMVRGLDYYCRTAFEVIAEGLGAQDAVGGGGRYDGLIAELGGPEIAGIGFACGIERMDLASAGAAPATGPSLLVAPLGADALAPALALARRLRQASHVVELGEADRKLKAQLKRADRNGARWVVIIGEDELRAGRATVRDMATRTDLPSCFALEDSAAEIMGRLQRVPDAAGTPGTAK
jgi:histidyl-tRNA synthetase